MAQRVNVIGCQPYAELGEQSINRRTCRDLDGDGDVDFAIEVACCTYSSPSLVVIYERSGHGGLASPTGASRPCAASSASVAR